MQSQPVNAGEEEDRDELRRCYLIRRSLVVVGHLSVLVFVSVNLNPSPEQPSS